ncbi:MAG: hypothetical protein O3A55_01305 [Bacteroidetes bacterium]|nr:hypothetical protein [Bacteroidota bacterium]
MKRFFTGIISSCILIILGCETTVAPVETIEPKFSSLQANIFDLSCSTKSCHGSDGAGSLFLTSDKSYNAIVNKKAVGDSKYYLVKSGNADSSFLYIKITNPTSGSLMPLGNPKLSDEKINAVKNWINNGAQNN